jgi:trimeric autotransporter adhesin
MKNGPISCTRLVMLAVVAVLAPAQSPKFVISTVAGAPLATTPVRALSVAIGSPQGIAADTRGNVYFTTTGPSVGGNQNALLKLDQTSTLTRATGAQLSNVSGVVVDKAGNLYLTDQGFNRVRKVSADGSVNTIAGAARLGSSGDSGDGGPAINATLYPNGLLAMDAVGNLYVGENTPRIRKISVDGTITTVAGNGTAGYSVDGGSASSAQLGLMGGLAVDPAGNLYISEMLLADDDTGTVLSARIRMVSLNGTIQTIAGGGTSGYSGDGGPAINAQLIAPGALATDTAGNLYIVDGALFGSLGRTAARIRKISKDGTISTIAGNGSIGYAGEGGPAASAQFGILSGLATDSSGNLYVADTPGIRKISRAGIITTVAGVDNPTAGVSLGDGGPANVASLSAPTGVAVDSTGAVYISDTFNNRIRKVTGDGIINTIAGTDVNWPSGLAMDAGGNVYVADSGNGRIRKISTDGIVTTVAGSGQAIQPAFSGDGGPATSAKLWWPKDVALDHSGNLYIADTGNNRIRMVTSAGIITTIAGGGVAGYAGGFSGDGGPATSAQFLLPSGLAVDRSGNVYVADTNNFRVRQISPSGIITTLAGNGSKGSSGDGGPAAKAQLTGPFGLKLDGTGNLFIADGTSVRMVTPAGVITTVAGTGVLGFSGDGGPATGAELGAWGLAFDGTGNLYLADPWDNNVRVLRTASSPVIVNVVNAASNLGGSISAGELVVVEGYGLGPAQLVAAVAGNDGAYSAQLAGTTVLVDGIPAQLIYSSATQVAAVVPDSVSGGTAQLAVAYQGQSSASLPVAVAPSAPGIFTVDSSGYGHAVTINQDGTTDTPVDWRDVITLFLTGAGRGTPAVAVFYPGDPLQSEVPISADPPNGLGVMQIKVPIPFGIVCEVPVVVKVGDTTSQAGVTIPMKLCF